MSLRVWLPLNGSLENKGLDDVTVTNNGAVVDNNGKIGKCYSFGTENSYMTVDSEPIKHFTEFSFACWVKIISWNKNYATIFAIKNSTNISWNNLIFSLLRNGSSSTLCFNIDGSNGYTSSSCHTEELNLNTWYHIAGTYKAGEIRLYQDGVLVSTYETAVIPAFNAIDNFWIGKANANSYQSNILLNDFRIYDHALSPMEVKQISQGLILHYPLNHGGLGQENLIKNSNIEKISKNTITTYDLTDNGVDSVFGQTLTISAYIKSDTDNAKLDCYVRSSAASSMNSLVQFSGINTEYKKYTAIIVCNIAQSHPPKWFAFRTTAAVSGNTSTATFSIKNVKLEEGTKATPWCPAPSDDLYSTIGADDTIEYDCSGYSNNGTKIGTIDYSSDTPRYDVSTSAQGSSGAKIIGPGMPAEAKSASIWVKSASAKTVNSVFFADKNSTLECGLLNSFIYVKTNYYAGFTTTHWKDNQWNHIVVVNDNDVRKVYVNGEPETASGAENYYLHNADAVYLWTRSNNNRVPFNGQMSDFRIYATALSPEDVLNLYNLGAAIDTNNNLYGAMLEEV